MFEAAVDRLGAAVVRAASVEVARNAAFHCFSVFPSRAISGIGQDGKVSMIFSAIRRPSAGECWW